MHRLGVIALVGLLASTASGQTAQLKGVPRTKLDRGMKLVEERRYDDALKELRQGYALSNAREFLYAMGQVERLRGNCRNALTLYQTFLDSEPPPDQVSAAKVQMARCEAELKPPEPSPKKEEPRKEEATAAPVPLAPAPAPPPQAGAPAAAGPVTAPPPSVAARAPWYANTAGDLLLAGGVVLAGGGAAVFVLGRASASSAKSNLDNYAHARDLSWAQPAGIVMMSAGGALIVGSVLRYATAEPESPTATITPIPSGAAFVVSGRF